MNEELEINFSPSYWSKRLPQVKILEEHIKFITQSSEEVKRSIPNQVNVRYGPGTREIIDIYGTDLPSDAPIFIHFHGGYWQAEQIQPNNNSFIAKILHGNKIKSMFVGYELCPNVTLADISINCEKALQNCICYAKSKKSKGIHLSGHSAGAQIVAKLFDHFIPNLPDEDRKLFKSAFLLAGIYDLLPLLQTSNNVALKLDERSAEEASPLRQKIKANGTVFHVVIAEYDTPKFQEQGRKMHDYLSSLGIKSNLVFIENVDHFDLIEKLYESDYQLTKLIVESCLGN